MGIEKSTYIAEKISRARDLYAFAYLLWFTIRFIDMVSENKNVP